MNLLEETKRELELHGKNVFDVVWFGTREEEWQCDLQSLININYDNGFGAAEIPEDFIIVGDDFWLERGEYDGSEWWEFKEFPNKPSKIKSVVNLICYDK